MIRVVKQIGSPYYKILVHIKKKKNAAIKHYIAILKYRTRKVDYRNYIQLEKKAL